MGLATNVLAGRQKKLRPVAAAVVGQNQVDRHNMPFKPAGGPDQKTGGEAGLLIGQ